MVEGEGRKGQKKPRLHKWRPEGYTTACHLCLHYTKLHHISAGWFLQSCQCFINITLNHAEIQSDVQQRFSWLLRTLLFPLMRSNFIAVLSVFIAGKLQVVSRDSMLNMLSRKSKIFYLKTEVLHLFSVDPYFIVVKALSKLRAVLEISSWPYYSDGKKWSDVSIHSLWIPILEFKCE